MKTARSDHGDPIPLQTPPHNVLGILIRFVGLLFAAVAILAFIWSR